MDQKQKRQQAMTKAYLLLIQVNYNIDTIIDHELGLFFVDLGLPKYSAVMPEEIITSIAPFLEELEDVLKINNIKYNEHK